MKFEAPRGTHDILPSDQPLWQRVAGEAERLCALYGYRRIVTPGFEDTELFVRTSGEGSDVVQKEMYTFQDRGGRSLTLRPEATAPICRAYLQDGMHREPQPVKLYTLGPMWRYDRPQKGRYREHWQLSVEAIGSDDPAVDAELIQFYDELLSRLGITGYVLYLNSIGDPKCRPAYVEKLEAWLEEHDSELDDDARAKRSTTPLRVFDVKSEQVQALLAEAPKIGENLCDECREHFEQVQAFLDAVGVRYELEPTLVRGLDYYTARRSSSRTRRSARRARSAAAAATTGSSRRSAGRRHRASASAPGSSACSCRWESPSWSPRRSTSSSSPTKARTEPRSRKPSSSCAAGDLRRHGLCGPLGQGPADAGQPSQRGSDRRRTGRDAGRRRDREELDT